MSFFGCPSAHPPPEWGDRGRAYHQTPTGEPVFTRDLIELGIRPSIYDYMRRIRGRGPMSKTVNQNASEVEKLRINEKKWSKTLMDAGWNAIPNVLIEKQAALGLDAL